MKVHSGKVIALALFVLVSFGCGSAYGISWEAGLKVGMTSAKLTGDPVSVWLGEGENDLAGSISDFKLGLIGGLYARIDFNDRWGVLAEVLYKQKGGEGPASGTAMIERENDLPLAVEFDGTLTLHLDYVEVPVLAAYSFRPSEGSKWRMSAYAGPTFSYNISAEMQLEGQFYTPLDPYYDDGVTADETQDVDPQLEDFEIGGLIGFSISYSLDSMDLLFDARWGRGFTTIDNTAEAQSSYNSAFDLMAGFSIPFGRE